MKLVVATCQFPISGTVASNLAWIGAQMREARRRGAHVAHFPETALVGYAGSDLADGAGYDWEVVALAAREVMRLARRLSLWVVVGTAHRLSRHKPHNSLYIVDARGRLVERYDKRFCTGDRSGKTADLAHYSPGDHFTLFRIRGVACGALICHDFRYQELYREYKRLGARLIFHSYHNRFRSAGDAGKARAALGPHARANGSDNIWGVIVPPTTQAYAANNHMWVSASNVSGPRSGWPGFFVRPDGVITGRLPHGRPGVLVSTVDPAAGFYDASEAWRDRAMRGRYNSGRLVRDPRSVVRNGV